MSASLFPSSTNTANAAFFASSETFPLFTTTQIALPLELAQFQAKQKRSETQLTWQTATEQNTHHFDLERAENGLHNFETIGEIQAAGESKNLKGYEFFDRQPLPESFYRLKMVDNDGAFEYSKIVFVKRGDRRTLQVHPNPVVENELNLHFDAPEGELSIAIFDPIGRLVFGEKRESTGGLQTQKLHLEKLPPGNYRVQLQGMGFSETAVFLKN